MEHRWLKYFEILRPMTCFFGALTVFVGFLFTVGPENFGSYLQNRGNLFKLIAGMIIYFFTVGSGNTINDVFDYEIDKINRPKRAIVRGAFTKRQAVGYYIFQVVLILTLTILAALQSPNQIFLPILVFSFLFLSFSYTLKLKSTGLLANIIVGFSGALGFPFGAFLVEDVHIILQNPEILLLYFTAVCFVLMREISKDMEDIEGDSAFGVKSIALKWGYKVAQGFVAFFAICILGILIFVVIFYQFRWYVILFALISTILLLFANITLGKNVSEKKWRIMANRFSLSAQLFAILTFLSGLLG